MLNKSYLFLLYRERAQAWINTEVEFWVSCPYGSSICFLLHRDAKQILLYFSYIEKELKPGLLQMWNSGRRVCIALPFASFFLCLFFFFFFPSIYCSCPFPSCGNIEICPPFCPNTTDHLSSTDIPFQHHLCTSKYMIQCENNSKPMIKFNDHEYVVKEILYPEKVLILQDQTLGSYLLQGQCGFFYSFSDLIHNFDIPTWHPLLSFKNSSDCGRDIDAISSNLFPMRNDSHHCNDYNLYYWDEPS